MSIKDSILDLTIKKYWFKQIECGAKTHEYRNVATWKNRLGGDKWKRYHLIRFRNGQTVKSTDKNKVLYARLISVKKVNGKDTDLKINHDVYDIEFKLLAEVNIDTKGLVGKVKNLTS